MMQIDVPRAVVLYLLWLGFISGALLVAMSDALPLKLGAIHPAHVFTLLIEAELFFVLVIWPFFIPRLLRPLSVDASKLASIGGETHVLVLQVAALFVVSLPVALLCSNVADVSVAEFLRGHLLVAVLASFVAALYDVAAERGRNVAPAYFLALFVLGAGGPFLHHLASEHFQSGAFGYLSVFSPFWAAAFLDPDGPHAAAPVVMSVLFGVLTVAMFAAAPFLRRAPTTT